MKQSKDKANKKQNKSKKQTNQEKINLENEIIIGLTPKKNEEKKAKTNNNPKKKEKTNKQHKLKKTKSKNKIKKKKNKLSIKILKWTCIIIIFIVLIILLLRSSIFNIKEIEVIGNTKVTYEDIIKRSNLEINTNMFKYSKFYIKNEIKTNAYIEDVKIERKLNGKVIINVKERKPTYMLKLENQYAYINNQGYILEISETPIELPIIIGFETQNNEIKDGNRLVINDLKKLEDIIKIMNSANTGSIDKLITQIDITDKTNYKFVLDSEYKTIEFGEATNIKVKLLKIQEILELEKGISGVIYFQDSERTIFKETV